MQPSPSRVVIVRPCRHRFPVRRLIPTIRHASELLKPCAISRTYCSRFSACGSAPVACQRHGTAFRDFLPRARWQATPRVPQLDQPCVTSFGLILYWCRYGTNLPGAEIDKGHKEAALVQRSQCWKLQVEPAAFGFLDEVRRGERSALGKRPWHAGNVG
jgi:hypothetical protein